MRFTGRTLMAMTLTSKPHPYKAGFEPLASDVYRIPFAYSYRSAAGTTVDEFVHHLEDAFKRHVAAENVAAVIAEPVLGEGGFVVPPRGYFAACTKSARNTEFYLLRRSAVRHSAHGKMVRVRAFWHRARPSYQREIAGRRYAARCGHRTSGSNGCAGRRRTWWYFWRKSAVLVSRRLRRFETIEKEGLLVRSMEIGKRFEERARSWQKKWGLVGEVPRTGRHVCD